MAVEDWHINAAESKLFEYGSKYTGDLAKSENAFSSSDHDPVIVALNYSKAPVTDEDNDGGSLGWLALMGLACTAMLRRKFR
ncbi:GlyGly-CTERM sorting domain-containing protein [Shewanella marina]|uniref:GlyGly-CTERM sorting domain-containing protein n=1 Tax=Shewanella marina TaxID=487319 RepID=UPI0006849589|nr:GlyGly-CTERM sorting domain-containing protein [Shewanella marina]